MAPVLLFVKKTPSICPNRRTVYPNGRIASQSIDGRKSSGYDGITIKYLLNCNNESKEFREEFSR